jgi:hypothetical protein
MTEERLVLADLLEKASDGYFLRAVAEAVLQIADETDVEGVPRWVILGDQYAHLLHQGSGGSDGTS